MPVGRAEVRLGATCGIYMAFERRRRRDVRDACYSSDPGHMVVVSDCPTYVGKRAEKQAEHEDEAKLGLVDTAVSLRDPDNPPVAERTNDEDRKDSPDETTQMG